MVAAARTDLIPLLTAARERLPQMTAELERLVSAESPSKHDDLREACAVLVDEWASGLLGRPAERIVLAGKTHLRWRFGDATKVLLVGHFDTVWPADTLARWPFAVDGDVATGPGAFDMKSGLVQFVHALQLLGTPDGVTLLVTADEELGSLSSADLIRETAAGAAAALVAEAPKDGALKIERKGAGVYHLQVRGLASHAGLEPEKGVNAAVAAAHLVLGAAALGDAPVGTTVTPTVLAAGTTTNTVPAAATVSVDVRARTAGEQERVDAALRALDPGVPGATVTVEGGINRPPLEAAMSAGLFALAQEVAAELGLDPLEGVAVGGGSDGNLTAGVGVPTLDGLGACGAGAHAEGEHVLLSSMPERTALIAGLVQRLLA